MRGIIDWVFCLVEMFFSLVGSMYWVAGSYHQTVYENSLSIIEEESESEITDKNS